jgi:ribosomal subunit interface protein
MQVPLQVSFTNMDPSDAMRSHIEELAAKLDRFHDRIVSCRVVVRAPNRTHKGKRYHVTLDLKVPGRDIVINREAPQHQANQDIYVAIRDAFDTAARQLEDTARQRRGDVKAHVEEPSGAVIKLFPQEGYGFLEDKVVGEVYFHANSVPNDGFKKLKLGAAVRYQAEPGEKGLQAIVVKPAG